MGYRQQCLRNCVVGKHIFIVPGKSVTFKWQPGEIKNEVEIDTTISLEKHGKIPELVLLLNVLSKYYTRVLPYLPELYKERYGEGYFEHFQEMMGNSFFACVERGGIVSKLYAGATPSGLKSRQKFYARFLDAAYRFMNFDGVDSVDLHFNPHFLRGVCCDWMRYDLKMSWEDIAQVLGDAEWTIRKEYFHDLKVKSATEPFAKLSKAREELECRMAKEAEAARRQKDETVAVMERQIQLLTDQCEFLKEQSRRAEEKLTTAESENKFKDQQIANLTVRLITLTPGHASGTA
jgi:hypothetical protein